MGPTLPYAKGALSLTAREHALASYQMATVLLARMVSRQHAVRARLVLPENSQTVCKLVATAPQENTPEPKQAGAT